MFRHEVFVSGNAPPGAEMKKRKKNE